MTTLSAKFRKYVKIQRINGSDLQFINNKSTRTKKIATTAKKKVLKEN